MAVTPPKPLSRTNYLSWPPGSYDANADPNSPSYDPSLILPAGPGYPNYGDLALDSEQYFRPLERVHGMNLHAPGVGSGMQIQCTAGSPNVQILPGVALDAGGKHIFLAEGGQAEINPDADVPGSPPDLVSVTASGVTLPTAGYTGAYYVVVQWWETWDSAAYASDPNVVQYNDTPWLQLVTSVEYNPDVHVVLGKVMLDGSSNVTAASYGDTGGLQRTSVSVPAQSVKLQRASTTTAPPGAQSSEWGEVRAREAGGIEIVTAHQSDQVNLLAESGGNFSSVSVAAETTSFGTPAHPSIVLNAANGIASIGGDGTESQLQMLDNNGNETMRLEGKTGAAVVQQLNAFQNGVINVNTTYFRCHAIDFCLDGRSHNNNRALVDWGDQLVINFANDYGKGTQITGDCQITGNLSVDGFLSAQSGAEVRGDLTVDDTLFDGNGVPLMGNPARKVRLWTLVAGASDFSSLGGVNTHDVDFGSPTQLTAFASLSFSQEFVSVSYNGAGSAEISAIDGGGIGTYLNSGDIGDVSFPNWSGMAQTVTFRAKAGSDSKGIGVSCVVFFE
ncbi:MAG TPA: hypothetical protein VGG70_00710 [Candidatus Cybelea sp.]|jgi:hypothetical protein